jgi:hypothetical protein
MKVLAYWGVTCAVGIAAQSAFAQTAPVEWSSVAKITNGKCGDGATAQIVERNATMNIKTFIRGKKISDFDVALASDGSGKARVSDIVGRQVFEIPPGTANVR